MKTIKLDKHPPTVDELLSMAREGSILIVSKDGRSFLLEEADDFDREVEELGNSERFMRFLQERAKEKGSISIEEFAKQLDSTDA